MLMTRGAMIVAVAALAVFPSGGSGAEPAKGVHGERFGSVHALMSEAYAQARDWDPAAKLLTVSGKAPANPEMRISEAWLFGFVSEARQGEGFIVQFIDGVLSKRISLKPGAGGPLSAYEEAEEGWDGQRWLAPRRKSTSQGPGTPKCAVIAGMFVDTPAIQELLHRHGVAFSDHERNFELILFRPTTFDTVVPNRLITVPVTPVPKRLLGRSLWVADNQKELAFFDARTGKLLLRRPFGAKGD